MSEENKEVTEQLEEQEILALGYDDVLKSYAELSQKVGQVVMMDNIDEKSNKINIIRGLSDGTKQLFSITVTKEDEITIK